MAAGKNADVVKALKTVHDALVKLDSEHQVRTIHAVRLLLGHDEKDLVRSKELASNSSQSNSPNANSIGKPQDYFNLKEPKGKMEDLAVAARYREISANAVSHTFDDLQKIFTDARRNFSKNASRDLANAKKQGYFNAGREIVLSHYGQSYIDALPNRDSARDLQRPKSGTRGRKKKKTAKSK